MREDFELCQYYKFHKHKIIFFLAAMRVYSEELQSQGYKVHYEFLHKSKIAYEENFFNFLSFHKIKKVHLYDIEDKFFECRISTMLTKNKIEKVILNSPMFLSTRNDFKEYLHHTKKPFMKNFYEMQRKKFNLLLEKNQTPIGGKWSFDEENRKPLPKNLTPKSPTFAKHSSIVKDVIKLCDEYFIEHPGESQKFWLPVKRTDAKLWLNEFLEEKLNLFGPYEDALAPHSAFVYHSVLSPFLNIGLLTPHEVVEEAIAIFKRKQIPLSSVEGFIRQIIGWREFIRGIYQNFSEYQDKLNFWGHQNLLSKHWYDGTTGIAPLDHVIKKVLNFGYAHHIERLMVLGSLMTLLEIKPKEVYGWFMEMFVDSSDWVMGPNVYGMAIFSDGGLFATKPYLCGSNYYKKMGGYPVEDWCDGVDGLYWMFIEKHKEFFLKNPRLSLMVGSLNKMDASRKKLIFAAGKKLKEKLTVQK